MKNLKVISVFPDINTRVCDAQTQAIAKMANEHKAVNFISVTTDPVDVINEWCAAKELKNVDIWSDSFGEFGDKTNTLIPKIKKLARGFIILNKENVIVDMSFKKELSDDPDYELLNKYL